MPFFSDSANGSERCVSDSVNLDIVNADPPGTTISVNEVCAFQAHVTNTGWLGTTDVSKRVVTIVTTTVLSLAVAGGVQAQTYGSVEPIANGAVLDTGPLRDQSLAVRFAFAERLLQCGIVGHVFGVLSSTGSVTTIDALNTHLEVGAGGFAGATNPSFVYTVVDGGPNAATHRDIRTLTDSLGYVLSQGSGFLLDSDDPANFDFPAQYVVLNFPAPPLPTHSAALFEAVGQIDPELFTTDTSGYTQYGRAYLSLQSAVPDAQFIAGYRQAAATLGLEYTPIIAKAPSLWVGGAAFPGNDWVVHRAGEEYLARIPAATHETLRTLREEHLRFTRDALKAVRDGEDGSDDQDRLRRRMARLQCP